MSQKDLRNSDIDQTAALLLQCHDCAYVKAVLECEVLKCLEKLAV